MSIHYRGSVVAQFFSETQEGVLVFGETPKGRVLAALRRTLIAFVGCTLAVTVVLLPDYFFRYKDISPKPGLFFLSIALLAGLLAFAFGFARFARNERWVLDPAQNVLILERSVFGKERPQEQLDLSFVVRCQIAPGRLGLGRVVLVWLQDHDEPPHALTLVGGWGAGDGVDEIYSQIKQFTKKRKLRVAFE